MIAELISVGTELLLGNTMNTNSNYLAKKCAQIGVSNFYQITVGDNEDRLFQVIKTALSRSDILIITGGLGPTQDDITKEITAKVLKKELMEDKEVRANIEEYFKQTKREVIPENNWKQSMIIEGSTVIENKNGTAPGLMVTTKEDQLVFLLPGPPRELIPMFEESVLPYLSSSLSGTFYSKTVKVCGLGESLAETMIGDLIEKQTNPTIAPYAKIGEVHFRVTASAKSEEEGKKLVEPILAEINKRFGDHVFTDKEEENLEDVVVDLLSKHKLTLVTAESCSGGLLSGKIINVPGVSKVFDEGFITYSNAAKQKYLGVKEETLKKYGAVSKETAKEMALGAIKNTGKQTALAITGLAGPGGARKDKPVGLVYIACAIEDKVFVKECHFSGHRQKIRENTVIYALNLLRMSLISQFEK